MALPPEIENAYLRAEARGLIRYAAAPVQRPGPIAPQKKPSADPASGRRATPSEIEAAYCRAEARGLIRGHMPFARPEIACLAPSVPTGDLQHLPKLAGPGLGPFVAAVRELMHRRKIDAQGAAMTLAGVHRCGHEEEALLQSARAWRATDGGTLAAAYLAVIGTYPG